MADGADSSGHGGRGSARGASRGEAGVARVQGMSVQRVTREPAHRKGRRIGATDDDRAGIAQVGHDRAVLLGNVVLLDAYAIGVEAALLVDINLYGDRHPGQHAGRLTRGDTRIDRPRSLQCLFGQWLHDRVYRGIDVLQTLQ